MNDRDLQLGSDGGCPMSRRRLLLGAGAGALTGAIGLSASSAAAERRAGDAGRGDDDPYRTTFGRMFPDLASFAEPSNALTEALLDLGRPSGPLDAADDLAAGPVALIVDPSKSLVNRDNPAQTAGITFLGQFLDHDLTFDVGSRLGVPTEPHRATNGRSPRLDLDSVFGAGPGASWQLYDPSDRVKLRIESGGMFEDLARRDDLSAIIGDPRNDENLMVAGLHAAMILAHNRTIDELRSSRHDRDEREFRRARRLLTWHYQWIVVHELLPLLAGADLVEAILRDGPRFLRPDDGAFMPVEFQGAAYRMGHSQVRPSYRANLHGNPGGGPFFALLFDPSIEGGSDPDDLSGGCRAPRRFVGWQTFFDFGDGQVKHNKRIDTHLSTPLFDLPLKAIISHDLPVVLPQRTLLRHVTWSMPSGQAIAAAIGAEPLSPADLQDWAPYGLGLEYSTPLWYYVLKEAELHHDGLQLGEVGGRIVAETVISMLRLDPTSYLNDGAREAHGGWRPTWPSRNGRGLFDMVDLLTYAAVDPTSRGQ